MATREDILKQLKSGKVTIEEAVALLATTDAPATPFSMKVSEKGCVSFRGVPGTNGKFGLTLYAKSVQFLFSHQKDIEAFIAKNKAALSWEKKAAA